ncbi:MAG: hypothetical protein EXR95_05170 [Gemmatimonadetes bacterium]|nr:hypothetical protein [Gemmatimonadota bacterium]
MSDDGDSGRDRATLGGLSGHGYGVVESLPSLGKGRRLTGIFRTGSAHAARLRELRDAGRRLPFDGAVHFRHHSVRMAVEVEVARVEEEGGELVVEFSAYDIPYSLG